MNPLSLKLVGIVIGLAWLTGHALAMIKEGDVQRLLTVFPRSRAAGLALLTVDFLWTWWMVFTMDWGEFYYLRLPMIFLLPVIFYLVIRYVDEFLAVRALGILGLLAASPVLDAARFQPPESRKLVVVLAYSWIVMGMIWVGQPHLLRDQIGWLVRSAARWKTAMVAGIVYGAVVLLCAVIWY